MTALARLIQYWKDKRDDHTSEILLPWPRAVEDTITYLEQLEKLKRGTK